MSEYTNRLKLPLLIPNQSGKEITHNEALITIDNLLQNHIISKQNTPPSELKTGDMYIVAESATNAWLNKENQLAIFDNGWRFLEPINGMLFYVLSENCFYVYKDNWLKLETLIDFTKLQNTTIDNLQKDEVIKYNGTTFINTREINLLKLYINDKLLIDEDFNISGDIKISGVNIDEHIVNVVNTNAEGFAKADLSNLTEEGQNSIKNVVSQNTALKTLENVEINSAGQQKVFYSMLPDYEAKTSQSYETTGQEFTMDNDGFIQSVCYLSMAEANNRIMEIKINDIIVYQITIDLAETNKAINFYSPILPIKNGDKVFVKGGRTTNGRSLIFYPLKQL